VRFPQCLHMKAFSRFPDKWRRPGLCPYELRKRNQRPKCHQPMDSPARQLSNAEGCDPIEAHAAEKRSEPCLGPCKKKGATIKIHASVPARMTPRVTIRGWDRPSTSENRVSSPSATSYPPAPPPYRACTITMQPTDGQTPLGKYPSGICQL